jgi:hypothetical protein
MSSTYLRLYTVRIVTLWHFSLFMALIFNHLFSCPVPIHIATVLFIQVKAEVYVSGQAMAFPRLYETSFL